MQLGFIWLKHSFIHNEPDDDPIALVNVESFLAILHFTDHPEATLGNIRCLKEIN